ncbi:hypothetical protein MKW98_025220 [Papaver atlanticum]|uniref:Peptidase A1 domain-containing protein n=1 Tax=Papaver atlanticum TaxID=357466 RepID=A0AAD4X692_9MAGN|nr:hypothetical protein MKW98_025220 [Papaver atlanticum]
MGIPGLIFFYVLLLFSSVFVNGEGGLAFKVTHKFGSEANRSLKDLLVHDKNRHGRRLVDIDIPLGGDGKATGTGLYYTKLAIGSPPKDYFLQVDTGRDVSWVNCAQCSPCSPTYTANDLTLKQYDPEHSSTARIVPCSDGFCTKFNKDPMANLGCFFSNNVCEYDIAYKDGSGSAGYIVQDIIGFDLVTGNLRTTIGNANILFGCGMKQTGNFAPYSNAGLDGLIGFGASSKFFAHCLDGKNGGGIFAIGDYINLFNIFFRPHYNVNMKSIQVGNTVVDISKFEARDGKGTHIDSGTTLAYLPGPIFDPLRQLILTSQPNLSIQLSKDLFECFHFNKRFCFHGLYAKIPLYRENQWYCLGWQDNRKVKSDLIVLGGNARLVLYDLENQVLGLSDFNCKILISEFFSRSSTIGLKDEVSGAVIQVGLHDLSSTPARNHTNISSSPARNHMDFGRVIKLLLLSFMLYNYI